MPTLRSREITFNASTEKTLEKEPPPPPPLDPPTPSKSDAIVATDSSSTTSSFHGPRRRSLRLAAIASPVPAEEAIGSRKRKSRVSESPTVGEIGGLRQSGSLNLPSGTGIERGQAMVKQEDEVDFNEMLDFEADVVMGKPSSSSSVDESQLDENGEEVIEGIEAGMNIQSGARVSKRRSIVEEKKNVQFDLKDKLDIEETAIEDKLKSVNENGEATESMAETVSQERSSYDARWKGKGVDFADSIEMAIDNDNKGKCEFVVAEGHSSIKKDGVSYEDTQFRAQEVGEGSAKGRRGRKAKTRMTMESRKEAERNKAIELAPKYAFFKADAETSEEEEEEDLAPNADQKEDWPGPFSTARKIIRDRYEALSAREMNSASKKNDDTGVKIQWTPSSNRKFKPLLRPAPSLHDLCIKVLCENAEDIESLDGVPDVLKHRLASHLCKSRKMTSNFLGHLMNGSPTEIHLTDCSWATESQFEGAFDGCNTENLKVVEFDISGRCLPDYILRGILARSPNSLPLLTKISLKGNYRLSDDGLNAIVESAPLLTSVNLSQCSLITSTGITNLADKLESVLTELYIDECQDVEAMLILPALLKLTQLEVLSMAGIENVSDKFLKKLVSVRGSTMKEIVLSGCRKLTAASMKAVGESCFQLCSIDLQHLNRLNDSAIGYLANGCQSIQKLKLRRNAFSDEAVASFLEVSGASLNELSLNNVEKVAQQTAVAISRRCSSSLKSLDLSFCRNMTDEALGLIVDSCLNLRVLKLFGCTQVTNVFLEGHSNPTVKIIGSKGSVLDHIELPMFL